MVVSVRSLGVLPPPPHVRYIEAFRTKGFKSVVVVHFGDEVDFDNDGSGKCSGRLYNELRVPIVRNYWYGNFDIILVQFFWRVSQLHFTPHASCAMLYFVAMLIGC